MNRRDVLKASMTLAAMSSVATSSWADKQGANPPAGSLQRPTKGKIRVGVAIAEGATVIDFTGPWEVFRDTEVEGSGLFHSDGCPFELFTVASSRKPVRASGGLHIIPDFSVADAPSPHLIVVPALSSDSALREWIRSASATTDLTMSVCTGAFQLARMGLLDGLTATTHHMFYDDFADEFKKVRLVRGERYVEHDRIATAGGLTSGIDLALRVVERYFGADVATRTAHYMEYASGRWAERTG